MRAPEGLIERDAERDFEILAPMRRLPFRLDRRLEKFAEALTAPPWNPEIETFEGQGRLLAERFPLDDTPVVGVASLGIRKDLESLGNQREHGRRFGVSGMKLGVELSRAALIGAPQLGRREAPVHAENRVKIRHDLSLSLSILHRM